MQPRCFQDLVIEVSLIRPGPLQGGMVRPYVRRCQGVEQVAYPHPLLKPALEETLGVIVFQEQVIKVARDVAGFTPGRGELLRRALGSKNALESIERFRAEFMAGAHQNGVSAKTADDIWKMIAGFAGYSFSKAHAAAFAVIVYWSAWLRVRYPTEYFCGLLRNAPLGTYPARVLESEARRVGVKFLPFDINRSMVKPTVERGAIRFGLGYVKGIGDALADAIVQAKGDQPFRSVADLIQRVKIDRRAVEWLILAGAIDSFGERRQLLWNLAEAFDMVHRPERLPLEIPDEQATFAPMTAEQRLLSTFAATGVTAGMSLSEVRRDAFTKAGCLPLRKLRYVRVGAKVKVGGLIADGIRRPPTAKGVAFARLEDPDGIIDVIIPQEVYLEYREALRSAFVIVEGVVKSQGVTVSVTARRMEALR
jgi:error-prone DNA polymerase